MVKKVVITEEIMDFVETSLLRETRCKFCGSRDVVRFGYTKNVPQWWCKRCRRKFEDNKALPRMRSPMTHQSSALSMFYKGMSLKEIRTHLAQENNNLSISRSTLERWVLRFTKIAENEAAKHTPKVGPVWIADETVLRLGGDGKGGRNVWLFDIIDRDTRLLLATHMAFTRTTKAAQTLMEKAYERVGTVPERVVTDGLNVYPEAIERTFGADAKHIQSTPFVEKDSTNLIERFHSTLKTRTEIMRGMKKPEATRKTLDGWLIWYNFLRPHDALDGKTPAQVAGIDYPFKSWTDVIESQAYPTWKDYHEANTTSRRPTAPERERVHKARTRKPRTPPPRLSK